MADIGTDTTTPPPGAPGDPQPPDWPAIRMPAPPRRRRLRNGLVVGALVVALVLLAGTIIKRPYVIVSPGSATAVNGVITVVGAPTYDSKGDLLFLTVAVSNTDPNVWRWLRAELDPNVDVRKKREILGNNSREEEQALNARLMEGSQLEATKVALEYLGYTVPVTGEGAVIAAVGPDAPAQGVLKPGDVVVAVNGSPITLGDQLGTAIRSKPPGTTFVLRVERGGTPSDVSITTGTAPSGDFAGQGYLGVSVGTKNLNYDFPVQVKIDTGQVGGPSAGLAFTLAIIDEMTPGDLTGGKNVAVTGTMSSDGTVGAVGSVPQKAVTARRAGAKLMLVPPDEVAEAQKTAKDMKVVGVKTLQDALDALAANGGVPVHQGEAVRPAA